MEKRNTKIMILSIIALILVFAGATYAYFSARITGVESASTIRLTAGRMGIHYSEDDATVSVSDIYPRSAAWITKQITITGYNTTELPMTYDLGLNITSNTFKGGQLTLELTGVGANGTKIANIEKKSIVGQNRFFKIGTGTFNESDGDTHVYTIKIYFKDNGKDQNFNQEAVFNAKFDVKEHGYQVAKANQNHDGKRCYTSTPTVAPADGDEYPTSAGQYTYKYNYYWDGWGGSWTSNPTQNGWGVKVTDPTSTAPITEELCAYINDKPVVNMAYMFYNSQATSIDLSSFDTSNVINMNSMFYSSKAISLDLSSFDTSKVTNMGSMFSSASGLTALDLRSFDTSNVTRMSQMFSGATVLATLDLSSFDTSNVTYMGTMFSTARALTSLDLSSFDTSNVTSMSSMFNGASALTTLDLSGFDTSNVTGMTYMFSNASALTTLDLSSFNTSKVTSLMQVFNGTTSLTTLDLSSFDTSNVTDMQGVFSGASGLTALDLSSFDTSKVTFMNNMFSGTASLTTIDLSSFDTSKVTSMSNMFSSTGATVGYAKTQADADRFNNVAGSLSNGNNPSSSIPNALHFVVR